VSREEHLTEMVRLGQEILQENENISEAHTADLGTRYRYRQEGAANERERIIKLAENRICFDHKDGCDHAACYALSDLIALIKGE